jgi:hypothetical protein
MKHTIALLLALSAVEFAGPPIAGAAGMTATAGFDAADVVCIIVGFATFFAVQFIASYF